MIFRTILAVLCVTVLTAGFAAKSWAAETRGALSAKERAIAEVSAFASKGDQQGLRAALARGLDAGVTVNEFKEILVQAYAYCGFPRSLNALNTFMALENERGNRDEAGREPSPLPDRPSIEFGAENQTKLLGRDLRIRPRDRPVPQGAPLRRHLRARQHRLEDARNCDDSDALRCAGA